MFYGADKQKTVYFFPWKTFSGNKARIEQKKVSPLSS